MRKTVLYLLIYISACLNISARELKFHGESLATALTTLRELNTEYTVNFIVNDLDKLPVYANLSGLSMTAAVKRLCQGLPVKAKIKGKQIFIQYDKDYKVRTIKLYGCVLDAKTHDYLIGAKVELLGEDSVLIDSVSARRYGFGYDWSGKEVGRYTGHFSLEVPALPRNYIFRISYDDYRTIYYNYALDHVGRRETSRSVSSFYMYKEKKLLHEVTFTASRVRFYYKGDTIVYNADEFKLAEGSMLDALLKQLPGMELKEDGRIYHNGKFVDDLLLNGKEFFHGDKNLLLKNLPAYTVKKVSVYDKQSRENEWLGRNDESTQHHVIDVRLKKEYMKNWIANVEAGTGIRQDEMPYLARLFATRNAENSRITILAKANNLSDEGFNLSSEEAWKPNSGNLLRRNEMALVSANVESEDKKKDYDGQVIVSHSTTRQEQRTTSQTFLPNGDTYNYDFSHAKDDDWWVQTYNEYTYRGKQVMLNGSAEVEYNHFNNTSGSTSGLFAAPVSEVSCQLLDDLFSPTSSRPNLRDTLINRQLRENLGIGHNLDTSLRFYGTMKIKGTNDILKFGMDGNYRHNARQQFSRQSSEYTESQQPPLFRHQFVDTPPRSKFELSPFVAYVFSLGEGYRRLEMCYRLTHNNRREQESIYRLDQLTGADSSFARPIDLLPSMSEYQHVFDRTNSSLSHYIENKHNFYATFKYVLNEGNWGKLYIDTDVFSTLNHQRNDYERGSIDTVLYRFTPTFVFSVKPWIRTKDGHHAGLEVKMENDAPDLLNQAAIVDNTDPMNIRIGNPDLRYALRMETTLDGNLYSMNKSMHNRIDLNYGFTHNAIGMGQVYDRQTGIRTYRPENVNGNWKAFARHTINYSFGDGRKHSASMVTQFSYNNSVDLMSEEQGSGGSGQEMATDKSTVRNLTLSFAPKLSLSLGKHFLNFSSDFAWDRYSSDRTTFQNISAWQYRVGADATVHLPWKFDFTTALTLYGRTGYADSELNTTDVVWNARLARPFLKGKWLVVVDGFDILGQLSNVTRTINAQGRTESYTNVLPRYALLHVVYRFNNTPKNQK